MNDFLRLILNRFGSAFAFAVIAAAAALALIAALAVFFRVKYHGERRFPMGRSIAILALTGCAAAILYLTVLRAEEGRGMNLHLFRAWREAWNTFEFKPWANVLLNVAMFIPLGAFLPLSFRIFRRPYVSLVTILAATSFIETAQLIMARGTFDIDDIFCNALGGAVGYLSVMVILSLCDKESERKDRARRAVIYAVVPILSVLAISSIFIVYYAQPYGNLASAPAFRIDMSDVEWNVECELSEERITAPIYRAGTMNRSDCDKFARELLSHLGMTEDMENSNYFYKDYYDNSAYYSCQTVGSLMVEMRDGSYELTLYAVRGRDGAAGLDRETVEGLLAEIGIDIPASAGFAERDDYGAGYRFTLARSGDYAGTLSCRVVRDEDGVLKLYEVSNNITRSEHVADVEIISQAEAFRKLQKGDFTGEYMARLGTLTVNACELSYELDSKGFYRPVWAFNINGDRVIIEG